MIQDVSRKMKVSASQELTKRNMQLQKEVAKLRKTIDETESQFASILD